jgi:hypothetical protein
MARVLRQLARHHHHVGVGGSPVAPAECDLAAAAVAAAAVSIAAAAVSIAAAAELRTLLLVKLHIHCRTGCAAMCVPLYVDRRLRRADWSDGGMRKLRFAAHVGSAHDHMKGVVVRRCMHARHQTVVACGSTLPGMCR